MSSAIGSICADCGGLFRVVIAMKPGVRGGEWFLRPRCFIVSTTPDPVVSLDVVRQSRRPAHREKQGQH